MTSVTTNAPGDLELFHSRVMNLCVIGDGFVASLETTGGPAGKSLISLMSAVILNQR